jgi:hypothetical protein
MSLEPVQGEWVVELVWPHPDGDRHKLTSYGYATRAEAEAGMAKLSPAHKQYTERRVRPASEVPELVERESGR